MNANLQRSSRLEGQKVSTTSAAKLPPTDSQSGRPVLASHAKSPQPECPLRKISSSFIELNRCPAPTKSQHGSTKAARSATPMVFSSFIHLETEAAGR